MTACKSNLKNIGTALEMYSTDNAGKYPTALEKVVPKYLKSLPACVAAGEVTYKAAFGPNAPRNEEKRYADYYFIQCSGDYHDDVGMERDYPQYNGIQGLIERP